MSQQNRFTAWLSDAERAGIERQAREEGTTMNFVVRMAIRSYLGLSARTVQSTPQDVTPVTRNK